MKKLTFGILLAATATAVNLFIVYEAVDALTLTGAAQAQADFSFYLTLMLCGPAAAILALTGLQVSHMQGVQLKHPLAITLLTNILLPFVTYGAFKLLWP